MILRRSYGEANKWELDEIVMLPSEIVFISKKVIVIKSPGRHYHSGTGRPQGYGGGRYGVFSIDGVTEQGSFEVSPIAEFPIRPTAIEPLNIETAIAWHLSQKKVGEE